MVVTAGRSGGKRHSREEIVFVQVSRSKLTRKAETDHAHRKKPAEGDNKSIPAHIQSPDYVLELILACYRRA